MALTTVTKRTVIGTWCHHRFKRPDGTLFEVECTKEDYAALAKKNAGQPSHPDGTWVVSYEGPKFDSPDGKIGKLEYYDEGAMYVVRDDKGFLYLAEKTDIVNDQVDFSKVK